MDVVTLAAALALWVAPQAPQSTSAMPIREVAASAVSPDAVDRWAPFIAEAARRFSIPKAWIRAVMRAESGGQIMLDGRPITSRAGAMGLMQIMPETYVQLRRRFSLGPDPYQPHDNILAGAAYLREMFDRYGYPALFAAYNAGPERFESHIRDGENLPAETWSYLAKLGPGIRKTLLTLGSDEPPSSHKIGRLAPSKSVGFLSGRALFFALGGSGTGGSPVTKSVPGSTNITARTGSIFASRSDQINSHDEQSQRLLFVPLVGEPR
jgi:Transglycosylase SLT domain